ncbi:MAG: hypothetical protein J7L66_02355 [Anaerolineaceae bacterium]|nr:hypothetical protein [Anaerolineaceae bacterium]
MRIAYITLHWPRTVNSSIGKKIQKQIGAWRELNHAVQFFSHLHHIDSNDRLIDGYRYFYNNSQSLIPNELSRIRAARKLIQGVRAYHPDVIYLRWGMYVHPIRQIFNIAPTIIEINTNDFEEHKLLGFAMDLYNRMTRSLLLNNAAGHVFTTYELAHNKSFTKYLKPYAVISNGIDLASTPFYKAPNNATPHLIFIGSPGMAWHGTEKLVLFAQSFSDIKIDIVGLDAISSNLKLPKNITLHGYQVGKNYEELLSKADCAIGTLSLHLIKGMNEASPFKVRDCVARGIPCILPYKDTDLSNLECDQILNIPNTPDNIITHGKIIHDFIQKMRGKRIARQIIKDRIDSASKEKQRINFFLQIYDQFDKHRDF